MGQGLSRPRAHEQHPSDSPQPVARPSAATTNPRPASAFFNSLTFGRRSRLRARSDRPQSVAAPWGDQHLNASTSSRPHSPSFPLGDSQVARSSSSRRPQSISSQWGERYPRDEYVEPSWPHGSPVQRRRRSRLSQARHSLSPSLATLFQRQRNSVVESDNAESLQNSSASRISRTSAPLSPRLPTVNASPELGLDFERPPAEAPEPRPRQRSRPTSTLSDRLSAMQPSRDFSRLTASIRRRRSRRGPSEDNAAMLSRLLSVAAAATAASLVGGNPEAAVNDLRRTAIEASPEDGSFDGFLNYLRSGALATQLEQSNANGDGENTGEGNSNSLEFFRMFRFGANSGQSSRPRSGRGEPGTTQANNSTTAAAATSTNQQDAQHSTDGQHDDGSETRMVPILIVGIRSLSHDHEFLPDQADATASFLDALTSFPTTINIGLQSQNGIDGPARPQRGLRLGHRRRNSMGGLGLFSSRDTGRLSPHGDLPRPQSEVLSSTASSTPPGPYPPPTTPASAPLSTLSSGTSTPNHRHSISNMSGPDAAAQNDSTTPSRNARASVLDPTAEEDASPPSVSRPRRNSDSTGHLRFGSGSSRRRGVVQPDQGPLPNDRETNRSWIIYVLGGNYPENHPILSTPSLFTDSPTYEDMILLSSMLGPAKPPVTTSEDLAAAGGLHEIIRQGEYPLARDLSAPDVTLGIERGGNCLVCLSDFKVSEVVRQLKTCKHIFHRECIDEWLLRGRNSCPLCRTAGVAEKPAEPSSSGADSDPAVASAY